MSGNQQAEKFKEAGNKAFQQADYQGAIRAFTQAIQTAPSAVYYANRAAAYLKLQQYAQALQDTTKCMELDATYQKGAQRHVECLIRCARSQEAVQLADRLFMAEQTSRNRELLNEAQRAAKLIGSETDNFPMQIQRAVTSLLQLTAQAVKVIVEFAVPLASSEERQKSIASADKYDMEHCGLVEKLSVMRDNLTELGMKSLPEDLDFLQKSVPGYKLDPQALTFFYLAMQSFRTTADAFVHYGLNGFVADEEILKDKEYYLTHAANVLNQCPRGVGRLVLQASLLLQQQKLQDAMGVFAQLVKADPQYTSFVQQFQTYDTLKAQGSSEYKAGNAAGAAGTFFKASIAIFDFEALGANPIPNPLEAVLRISAEYLAAMTLSNEGMALSKMQKNGEALARLSAATFLDALYDKAHQRAGQIYLEKEMFLEAEREFAFASVISKDQALAAQVKDCQKRLRPYLRKDYYGILEIPRDLAPDSDEYQKKYKKICAKWHPDRYARDPVMRRFAQSKFRLIQEADGILRDKQKKMIYDQGGDPVNDGASGMGGMQFDMGDAMGGAGMPIDISQIFQMMGGMGGMGGGFPGNMHVQFQQGGQPQGRRGQQRGSGLPPGFGSIFDMFGM